MCVWHVQLFLAYADQISDISSLRKVFQAKYVKCNSSLSYLMQNMSDVYHLFTVAYVDILEEQWHFHCIMFSVFSQNGWSVYHEKQLNKYSAKFFSVILKFYVQLRFIDVIFCLNCKTEFMTLAVISGILFLKKLKTFYFHWVIYIYIYICNYI